MIEINELFEKIAKERGFYSKQLEETQEIYGSISSISGMMLRSFKKIGVNGKNHADVCPDCSGVLVMESGCAVYHTEGCGYTRLKLLTPRHFSA